jgi:hypothetical protein
MNIYVELTKQFNDGKLRAILSSGQAVVMHHLAIMSKDGDWLVYEDTESLEFILNVLDKRGARYRFGAPFDIRWQAGGWSSHFEFMAEKIRARTDFVCRPPRITPGRLKTIWEEQKQREFPFVDLLDLIELKKTNREKDYAIIGEIARRITDVHSQLRYSRSGRELMELCLKYPDITAKIVTDRPVLSFANEGLEKLEAALDAERRMLMHENEKRLQMYKDASIGWAQNWKDIERETEGLSLFESHNIIVKYAEKLLPFKPEI